MQHYNYISTSFFEKLRKVKLNFNFQIVIVSGKIQSIEESLNTSLYFIKTSAYLKFNVLTSLL